MATNDGDSAADAAPARWLGRLFWGGILVFAISGLVLLNVLLSPTSATPDSSSSSSSAPPDAAPAPEPSEAPVEPGDPIPSSAPTPIPSQLPQDVAGLAALDEAVQNLQRLSELVESNPNDASIVLSIDLIADDIAEAREALEGEAPDPIVPGPGGDSTPSDKLEVPIAYVSLAGALLGLFSVMAGIIGGVTRWIRTRKAKLVTSLDPG